MGQVDLDRTALLVTGTIVPNSSFVAHTNADQRRNEYLDGLLFYRKQFPHTDIFFLENSAYNFDADAELRDFLTNEKIHLLKFPVSEKFSEGKGYQEFEMLDTAIEQLSASYDQFIKITGRYKVHNIKDLVPGGSYQMIADSHRKHHVTQTHIFFISTRFYMEHLRGLYKLVNDTKGKFIEHVVYDELTGKNILDQVLLFKKNPVISGFSGSYGGSLNRNMYKMIIRNLERSFLNAFGFHQFLVEY